MGKSFLTSFSVCVVPCDSLKLIHISDFVCLLIATQNEDLTSTAADSQSSSSCGSSPNFSPSPQMPSSNFDDKHSWRPHPNNPDDYCSTIPPLQQIQQSGARPPPTVMVPIGVLKRGFHFHK